MANAGALKATTPARIMIVGYPGSGKTGALACLANAGYKLRIIDFDGNLEPLLLHLDTRALPLMDALHFEDELRNTGKFVETVGIPSAFNNALKAMKHWTYTDENGEEVDLGKSCDWGPDTVVVIDSLTSMGTAAFNRTLKACNRNPMNCTRQIWGSAMADQDAAIRIMRGERTRYHFIVLAHLKLIGPKDIEQGDNDLTKQLKAQVADIVPTRLFPSALGRTLSPEIGGRLPTLILAEAQTRANSTKRVLVTEPRPELDLKVPVKGLPKTLPIETGLLTIFEALGHKSPGFEAAASTPAPTTGDETHG